MTIIYKLLHQDMTSGHNHTLTKWQLGVPRTASGEGDLCGPGWLHVYLEHPLIAVIFNPIHAYIKDPRLFLGDGDVGADDHGTKAGCTRAVLTGELPLPNVTTTQRVAFSILCTKNVCVHPKWNAWADAWLSGEDRSRKSADATYSAAYASYAADAASAGAASAAYAAYANAAAADAAAAYANAAAADAADSYAAAYATYAAAHVAYAAASSRALSMNLSSLAQQAVNNY